MIEIRILRNTVVDVRTEAAAGEVLDVPADVAHALLCARAGELVRAAFGEDAVVLSTKPCPVGIEVLAMGPEGPVGQLTRALGLGPLPFTFWGLVLGSVFYSLPFMVQPVQNAFEAMGERPLEVAATLRASPLDAFFSVALPLALPGFLTASVLTFAHTVGEFGVVLMVGGNLPGITRVASVQIYDHVEALEYAQAHRLAAVMLVFSFLVLLGLYAWRPNRRKAA